MQDKAQQPKSILKPKPSFLLKVTGQQKPRRVMSLNRLNYPQNLQKDGTIIAKRDIIEHQLFDHHIVKTNMKIQAELKKLQVAFIHEKVPEFYAYYFMNRLLTASQDKIEDKIIKELQQVKNKRSFYHVISNAIKAREGCLKQLQRCLDNLFNNQDDNLTKHVFREQMTHYRKLTGFVISHIRSWKEWLNSISPEIDFTAFLYQGQDYLLKLLNDCQFIFNSFLTRSLKFSYRNDPYIMRPYLDGRQSKFLDIFKFDDQEKTNYMVDLNYLAGQRAKYLESKMNSKNDKIKQIQRIYHYRDEPLTSRIFVRKIPSASNKDSRKQVEKPEIVVDNFMSSNQGQSEKKLKLIQLSKKSEKIRKIKQIFGKTSQSNKLINQNMFQTIGGNENRNFASPYEQKLRYSQYHQKKPKVQNVNFDSDFQNLLRKKQLQILKGGTSMDAQKTQRSFKNIKIKDSLSDSRKFITNQEGYNELENILNQLDTFSPQKLENFKLKKKQDPSSSTLMTFNQGKMAKSRSLLPQKTLLEHNEEVYVNVRNQVIEQIEKGLQEKVALQQKKKQEDEKIQNILQKKINEQSLKIIKNSRVKQLQGRQHLAKQMESSQVFGYNESKAKNSQKLTHLEEQLRKEMQLKWLRQVQEELKRKTDIAEMQRIKSKQERQLQKQVQKVKQKEELQKRYQQIQRQQRAKATKKLIQLDEERKKQIEEQMRVVIQRQKESMERFAAAQKSGVEEQLRQAMKMQMLENLKSEKERYYDNNKQQEEVKKKESQFREEVRAKIQQQYRVGQQMKKNRQREQKLAKIRLVKQKLGQFDKKSVAKVEAGKADTGKPKAKEDKEQLLKTDGFNQKDLKSRITQFPDFRQSIFPKFTKDTENEKKKMREQFELQLFAFRKPEAYEENNENEQKKVYEDGKFQIKDFRSMIDKQMEDHQKIIESKQKQEEKEALDDMEIKLIDSSPADMRQKLQQQQKQKQRKENEKQRERTKLEQKQKSEMGKTIKSSNSDRFTKFSQQQKQKNDEDELIRMKLGMTFQEYQIYKKKKGAITARRDLDGEAARKKAEQDKKAVIKVIDDFQRMQTLNKDQQNDLQQIKQFEQQFPDNLSINKKSKQQNFDYSDKDEKVKIDQRPKRVKKDEQEEDYEKERKKVSPKKKKNNFNEASSRVTSYNMKRFETSENEQEQVQEEGRLKNKKQRKTDKKKKQKEQEQEQEQDKLRKQPFEKQHQKQSEVAYKPLVTAVKLRQIPVLSLSQFFTDHFEHLPKTIKKINIYKKQQLIRFLLEHSSFAIFEYVRDSVSIGLAILIFNQNKSKYRSLNVVHLGSYDESDYLELLLNVVRHCFRCDPCEEITMSNVYDRDIQQQWEFIKNFQQKFDAYGAIFQKKIFNTQFQRKFVLRRNIGQVCKVQPVLQFNRGSIQFQMNSFITQSASQFQVKQIVQSDQYEQTNFKVGYYGLVAHHLSERYSQQSLAYLVSKSTQKDSSMLQKLIGSLAKLSLSMKKNPSFRRLSELTTQKFDNIMNLNLELLAKHESVLPYPPQSIQSPINCIWTSYKIDIQLSYDFYSQTIPIKIQNKQEQDEDEYLCKYLRYTPNKKNKMFILKSSAYSTKITVLPCKDNKYKIFILDSEEYQGILHRAVDDDDRLDLGVYLRVFFANVIQHQLATYQHVWLPQTNIPLTKNQLSNLNKFPEAEQKYNSIQSQNSTGQQFFTAGIARSQFNYTYTDYIGNSLKVLPTHRDLLITPPFIIGILNMQIETALEGSPVFVRLIQKTDMSWIKEVPKVVKQSD